MASPERSGDYPYKNRSVALSPGDIKLLDYIQDKLGCSRSDAMRSAIRVFAGQLAQIDKRS